MKLIKIQLLLSLVFILPMLRAGSNELPDMGSSINKLLPLNLEQELGDNYIRFLRQQLPVIDDPQVRTYINNLGFRLVASNEDAENRQFYFFVINDPAINAFAMPGGYIGINSGLIQNAENESELAGVMAHEIAHVTQRHLARRLEQQSQLSMPMMLAALGSILVMTQNAEAGMAALTGIQAGATQVMINHTRTNESEADRIGIVTLAKAGFNPTGMATFFEKLLQLSRYSGKRLAFLSTHPLSQNRITESRDRARELPVQRRGDDFNFNLVRERLASLLVQDYNPTKRIYENKLAKYQPQNVPVSLKFGYALTLSKLGQYTKAEEMLRDLSKSNPDNLFFSLALAETYIADSKPHIAIGLLKEPYRLNPGNDSITLIYAKALLEDEQVKKSLDILYEHLPKIEKEPSIYELMAEAQSKEGLYKEVHESTGMYLYYSGDLQGALAQFKMSMNGRSNDPYFNSRLLARIRKVQKEILEMKQN